MGTPQGTHHNGYLRFCGDFKYTVTEMMQLSVVMDIAFRKNRNRGFILFQNLNAVENGLQRFPVVFPVDGLAEDL